MKKLISGFIVYKDMNRGDILYSVADMFDKYRKSRSKQSKLTYTKAEAVNDIY